jgi:membrane-associated phospholipid phosphatase
LFKGSIKRKIVLFFIFSQGYVLTESLTGLTKGLIERYRPFAYMSKSGLEDLSAIEKEKFLEDIVDYDILNSFFSGDASILAYGLVFFAFSYSLIYNSRISKNVVWIAVFLGVFLGCYFRTLSGKHFPTDVIVGGLVGVLVAVGIIKLHINMRIEFE